jgi:hypothetical protein
MDGKAVAFDSPRDASNHGIATVHQGILTVWPARLVSSPYPALGPRSTMTATAKPSAIFIEFPYPSLAAW